MKHFIGKIGIALVIGAISSITCLNSAHAVGNVSYISGMYRKNLNPELYSPYWKKVTNKAETVTRGLFRGHEIRLTMTHDGQASISSSDSILKLVFDFIHDKNLERYDLSKDEKAYLAISFYHVLRNLELDNIFFNLNFPE